MGPKRKHEGADPMIDVAQVRSRWIAAPSPASGARPDDDEVGVG